MLKDRAVWAPLAIAFTYNLAFFIQNEFALVCLRLSYQQPRQTAAQIANIYSFASVVTGAIVGYLVLRIRYLRPFIIIGAFFYAAGFILLAIHPHVLGDDFASHVHAIIGSYILMGVGGGLLPYLTMASLQAAVNRDRLALITGIYLGMYRFGAAMGVCIAVTLMNQLGLRRLRATFSDDVASYVYTSPLGFANEHFCDPLTNPESTLGCAYTTSDRFFAGVVYVWAQQKLYVIAAALCAPLLVLVFLIRNPKLGNNVVDQDKVVSMYLGVFNNTNNIELEPQTPSRGHNRHPSDDSKTPMTPTTPKEPKTPRSLRAAFQSPTRRYPYGVPWSPEAPRALRVLEDSRSDEIRIKPIINQRSPGEGYTNLDYENDVMVR